jgi:hypothetical protein
MRQNNGPGLGFFDRDSIPSDGQVVDRLGVHYSIYIYFKSEGCPFRTVRASHRNAGREDKQFDERPLSAGSDVQSL